MIQRPRRNRKSKTIREGIQEYIVRPTNLVLPLFLVQGKNVQHQIPSLPIAQRLSLDNILKTIDYNCSLGIDKFILFPIIPENLKDSIASYSYVPTNFYLNAAREIKKRFPNICLISDVAMDPYSSDGHDGIVIDGIIDNDKTLPILSKMAIEQANAGFDVIGPSDMMDGRVFHIRESLDQNGFSNTSIMSYTAKYASAFYGPFRDALDSQPKLGDKKSYQMDSANKYEALIEAELDEIEGADFLMVKPALHYLDIIHLIKEHTNLPVSAYHVSGECAMLLAAAAKGWIDYHQAMVETLLSIRRAGANLILTYLATDYAKQFKPL